MTIITEDRWHGDIFYLLYWLPNPLQFGSFSLLPLFYSQVYVHAMAQTSGNCSCMSIYFVASLLFSSIVAAF
ncbi:unnamed protein product, partial [Scytosiphon promiscuus]